jgi:ABC-type glycerol-3-phosphate transport system permease component
MIKKKNGWTAFLKLIYVITILIVITVTILPILFALGSSLRTDEEIFKYAAPFSYHTLVPQNLIWDNYTALFSQHNFLQPVFNSFIVAVSTVVLGFVVNALAGFAFAKFEFRGKNVLFVLFLFSFMIPFEMIAVPLYKTAESLSLIDTYAALILPMVANGMIVFLYRQFFKDIPDSLIEAATIDGAGKIRTFFQIIVPVSKPVIISASLMLFIKQWDAFLWPMLATTKNSMQVIQVAISGFTLEFTVLWGVIFAATVIAIVIPVLILVPLQRYYIKGAVTSGLKG